MPAAARPIGMPIFYVQDDLRFPGRFFLYTIHNDRVFGASFCGRRERAEAAILAAIAAAPKRVITE